MPPGSSSPALEAVRDGATRIIPERDEKIYFHWLENIEPWCISRQLWWGHQIPVWYGRRNGEHGSNATLVDRRSCRKRGSAAADRAKRQERLARRWLLWHRETSPSARLSTRRDWLRTIRRSRICGAARASKSTSTRRIWRDPDVLDTWFSSGLWPIGTLGWPERHAGAEPLLPDLGPRHRLRHPLLLGRPDDDDAARRGRRGARSTPSTSTPSSATRRARRCRSRSATCSTRSS